MKAGRAAPAGRDFEKSCASLGRSDLWTGSWVGESSTRLELDEDCVMVLESGWAGGRVWALALPVEKREFPGAGRGENGLSWLFWKILLLSKYNRGRALGGVVLSGSSGSSGESSIALARANRERSLWRCWRVDRLREDERFGIVAKGLKAAAGTGNGGVSVSFGERDLGRSGVFEVLSPSNIPKSPERLAVWTLRLFADGLPRDARSKFIIPSLRFSGLTVGYEPKVPLRRFSIRDNVGRGPSVFSGHVEASFAPGVSSSEEKLNTGVVSAFSIPDVVGTGWAGLAFP